MTNQNCSIACINGQKPAEEKLLVLFGFVLSDIHSAVDGKSMTGLDYSYSIKKSERYLRKQPQKRMGGLLSPVF